MMCGRRLRLDVQKNISSARPYGAPACYVCAEPLGVPHEPFVYDAQLCIYSVLLSLAVDV